MVRDCPISAQKEGSTKTSFKDFSEFNKFIGKVIGESDWFYISQKIINDFALSTNDLQWIHTDRDKASTTPFHSTIVHGWLTISLSPFLLNQIFEIKNVRMGINYGADKIRFLKPIPVDSEIKLEATLIEVAEVANKGFKIRIGAKYFLKNFDKPVCVAEFISINYC
jgi:acyl dehydratase